MLNNFNHNKKKGRGIVRLLAILTVITSIFASFSVCLTSCKTLQNEKSEEDEFSFKNLSIKTNLGFGKGERQLFSVSAQIRMAKDSLIVLSVQPFAGIEIGRLAVSQHDIVVVDRLNKRFFKTTFEDVRKLVPMEISYNVIQAALLNQLFAYEKEKKTTDKDFNIVEMSSLNMKMFQRGYKDVTQEFVVDQDNHLQSGRLQNDSISLRWKYSDFSGMINDRAVPMKVEVEYDVDPTKTFRLTISHKKIEVDALQSVTNQIPSSYQQLSVEDLKNLFKNAQMGKKKEK